MGIDEASEKKTMSSTFIFMNCEAAYNLIKDGKAKEAEEKFPLEHYLIQKYQHLDFDDFSKLIAKKLLVSG